MKITRRFATKSLTALAAAACTMGFATIAQAQATIKVGVLHSLSGTMAISET
ncbi:MAG: urea ABC transporter substrate-binding protein, partial [Burkholderiaceae bacterium]